MVYQTRINDKVYKQCLKAFASVKKAPYVIIGVLDNSGDHKISNGDGEKLTIAEVATYNEFGTESVAGNEIIPERSFIRSTVDKHQESYHNKTRILQEKMILNEMTSEVALAILGEQIQSDIIETINQGVDPENAAATVAAKGSSTPLIDSGQLKQSIRYEVKK